MGDKELQNELDQLAGDTVGESEEEFEEEELEEEDYEAEEEEEEDDEEEEEEEIDDDDDEEDDKNEDIRQLLKEIVTASQQKPAETKEEEEEKEDLFEENFKLLADQMDWEENEAKAMKGFLKTMNEKQRAQLEKLYEEKLEAVKEEIEDARKLESAAKQFYDEHPAFKGYEDFVAFEAKKVASEMTKAGKEADWDTVTKKAAKRCYKKLGLTKKSTRKRNNGESGKRSPAFPRTKSARKEKGKKDPAQAEIDRMLNTLD